MGCGTSKENVAVQQKSSEKNEQNQAAKNSEGLSNTIDDVTSPIVIDADGSCEKPPEQETDLMYKDQIESPKASIVTEEPSELSEEALDEITKLEAALADATVSDVLQSLETSFGTSKSKGDNGLEVTYESKRIQAKTPEDISGDNFTPFPSGTPVGENVISSRAPAEETFQSSLNKACQITDNTKLLSLAPSAHILKVDRTFYCFTKGRLLSQVVSSMKNLCVLDLRGGQCGPIAFRTVINALMFDQQVKDLNLSDNSANPECSEILGKLLVSNKCLQHLNVSGNQLGKDALSRYVGTALGKNSTLLTLNISGCGATDLHCLCESLRNSPSTALTCLVASHNFMTDGNQFGVDLSLFLESENCKLEILDVTNSGITSSGLNAISASLTHNISLKNLAVGQNTVQDLYRLGELILNGCGHSNLVEFSLNKTGLEESIPSSDVADLSHKTVANQSQLTSLGIADCGLSDALVQVLAKKLDGKLSKLQELDASSNNDLSFEVMVLFDPVSCGNLKVLKAALLEKPNALTTLLSSTFAKLEVLDVTRSRLSPNEIKDLCASCCQKFAKLILSGIKLSGTGVISSIASSKFVDALSYLTLSGCQLSDEDMQYLHTAMKSDANQPPLRKIDLSVNRLTSAFMEKLVDSLLAHGSHLLEGIDLSNNLINDGGLDNLAKLFACVSHASNLTSVDLSCNDITATSMVHFFQTFTDRPFPLEYLDFRNQSETFTEEGAEMLGETLKTVFFETDSSSEIGHAVLNLVGLGGADVPSLSSLDSQAIKTDFLNLRKPSVLIKDIFEIADGIQSLNSSAPTGSAYEIPSSSWKDISGKDAPGWAFVTSHLKNAACFASMPATVTIQRLQGMLEMEADCEVEDVFLIKDPIMRKPTGAAWVLFADHTSLTSAVEWYVSGSAQMYGTPFTISDVPAIITDESEEADSDAKKDIAARELEQKKRLEQERQLLEESQQLAAERAEYREAHPAYQGGRIS